MKLALLATATAFLTTAASPVLAQDLSIYRTANPAQIAPKPQTSRATTQALQGTLYELIGLQQNVQQLHWNVVGPTFYATHEMLGEFYKTVAGYVDLVAERNRALNVPVDGRPSAVAANANLPEMAFAKTRDADGIKLLSIAFKAESDRLYARIDAVEKEDPVTANMLQEVAHDIDKQLWMLRAYQEG